MKEHNTLADTEWRLMQIIWEHAPRTFREICDIACPAYGWSKHAVISYLKRMEAKGAIRVEDAKPVKLYYPLLDRDQAIREETKDVLERVYHGSVLLMVQSAVHQQGLSETDFAELERILKGECRHNA